MCFTIKISFIVQIFQPMTVSNYILKCSSAPSLVTYTRDGKWLNNKSFTLGTFWHPLHPWSIISNAFKLTQFLSIPMNFSLSALSQLLHYISIHKSMAR